ncbi:uncharacterized protein ACBT57_023529 isoform 1-T1 [Dama dama]
MVYCEESEILGWRLIPSLVKLKLNVAAINTRLPPGFHPTRRREFKPQEDQECPSPSLLEYPRWSSSSHIKKDSQGSGCENCGSKMASWIQGKLTCVQGDEGKGGWWHIFMACAQQWT